MFVTVSACAHNSTKWKWSLLRYRIRSWYHASDNQVWFHFSVFFTWFPALHCFSLTERLGSPAAYRGSLSILPCCPCAADCRWGGLCVSLPIVVVLWVAAFQAGPSAQPCKKSTEHCPLAVPWWLLEGSSLRRRLHAGLAYLLHNTLWTGYEGLVGFLAATAGVVALSPTLLEAGVKHFNGVC